VLTRTAKGHACCHRSGFLIGQDRERDQRAVPPLDVRDRRHALDDMSNLFQGWNARRPSRFGDPRFFNRKTEVFGVRIGNPRLV
jgi:hypothetical protein